MSEHIERVLLLTHELSFRGSSILALRLAQGLASRSFETVLICTKRQPLDAGLTDKVRIVEVPGYATPIWGRVVRQTVFNQLHEQPPDVIHIHGPRMLAQGLWLGKTLDRPVVLNISDQTEAPRINMPLGAKVDRIICVSESVKAALSSRFDQTEQRVILPGVPLDLSKNVKPVLQDDHVPVVGMAGPLEVIKGGSFFLRACHRVLEAGKQIRIVVTGSGPEERNLRRLSTSLELDDHVTFVDDGAAMEAYLSAIDIFCLPSLQQGFGVIMLEAMALGRPVIASGVGGILSILEDGRNGIIVPPSDSRALADRILQLLNEPELAQRMAIAGRNLVEDHFTRERMVNDVLQLYGEVTKSRKNPVASIPMSAEKDGRS